MINSLFPWENKESNQDSQWRLVDRSNWNKTNKYQIIIIDDVIGGIPDNDVAEVIEAIKNHPLNKLKQFSLISIGHHE